MLRREDRVERRTSKAGATAKNASTVKRRGKGKEKASANPSGSAWFRRRRDAPTTDDVIATDGVVADAKPDTGRGGGGTRWEEEEEEEDLDGVRDEEGEETVPPPGKAFFIFIFCAITVPPPGKAFLFLFCVLYTVFLWCNVCVYIY